MKNAPSTTSYEFVILHEHENFTPIEQIEEPYMQNPEGDDTIITRKSKRQRTAKSFGDDYIVYLVDDTPTTIEEAYSSPDADLWKEVVQSEMDSIMSNGTWEIVDRPYGCKTIGCGANGCSGKSLGLMVLSRGTRQGLWPRVILKRKVRISLILIHRLPD